MSSLYVLYDNLELNLRVRRATPLSQLVRRAAEAFENRSKARAARRTLSAMPDYLLRDLGIERDAIDNVARGLANR